MRKWVVIRPIDHKKVDNVRFWYKWSDMDIAYIQPIELISGIVEQRRAK